MEDSNSTQSDRTTPSSSKIAKSGRKPSPTKKLRSRQVIADSILRSADLTTIQGRELILFEEGDPDKGAEAFRERFKILLGSREAVLIWVVWDTEQLHHVVSETRRYDPGLYKKLINQAIFVKIDIGNPIYQIIENYLNSSTGGEYLTLTATPSTSIDRKHYEFHGHMNPAPSCGWDDGPRSHILRDVPDELDLLVKDLHEAYTELTTKVGDDGKNMKKLVQEGIFAKRLEELVS